jgi:hypothetical protein
MKDTHKRTGCADNAIGVTAEWARGISKSSDNVDNEQRRLFTQSLWLPF